MDRATRAIRRTKARQAEDQCGKVDTEEAQRAKKRAWDRSAQRRLREKTKSRLAHLEETVRVLEDSNQDRVISDLMQEVGSLRAENERLQKIIRGSISALQAAAGETVAPDEEAVGEHIDTPTGDPVELIPSENDAAAHVSLLEVPATVATPVSMREDRDNFPWLFEDTTLAPFDRTLLLDGGELASMAIPSPLDHHHPTNLTNGTARSLWSNHTRTRPRMPGACSAWLTANQIFEDISRVDVIEALCTDAVDAGPLLQAIHLGWDTLARPHKQNPSFRILRQMDEQIWSSMPKVHRAAIAYKSYMLIRYLLNPDNRNLHKLPEWEKPSALQRYFEHPIAIDFFPWPALRERLILNEEYYLDECNIFARIKSDFRFTWPYAFEDMFLIEQGAVNAYRASPTFVEHVRDLGNWTLTPAFFETFPELLEDFTNVSSSGVINNGVR